MGHLVMTPLEGLFALTLTAFLFWSPMFALAYSKRRFGGTKWGYVMGWAITSLVTILLFVALSIYESAWR